MCLAIPGKIVETYSVGELKMGKVDYGGVVKEACLAYVPDAEVGQYVIVHAGFALNVLDDAEAQETLALFREMGMLEEETGGDAGTAA
jgi:hydrogenase expression/formation protein HypC